MDRSQEWLIERVKELTGLYMDSKYMSKVLNGQRNPPKIISAINQILELESG